MRIRPAEPVYRKIKGRWVEVNPLDGVDAQVTIIGGIRYTLGRASYSPGCSMDFCRAAWPWATFAVNLVGCLVLGLVLAWVDARHPRWSHERPRRARLARPFLASGVLGASVS